MSIMNVTTVAPKTVSPRTDRNRPRCVRRTGRPRGLDPGLAPWSKIEAFRYCGGAVAAIPLDAMPEYLLKFYVPRGDARVAPDDGASARAAAEELTRAERRSPTAVQPSSRPRRPVSFASRPSRPTPFATRRCSRVAVRAHQRRLSAGEQIPSQHRRGPLSSTSHPSGGDHAHFYAATAAPILRLLT